MPFMAELALQCGAARATAHELRHLLGGLRGTGRLFTTDRLFPRDSALTEIDQGREALLPPVAQLEL